MQIPEEAVKSLVGVEGLSLLNARVLRGASVIFELLNKRKDYGLTYDQVVDFALANLDGLTELRDTIGLSFNKKAYRSEGYESFYDKGYAFLRDTEGALCLLTYHPDSIEDMALVIARDLIASAKLYICREELWSAVYSLYIEPEIIKVHAVRAVAADGINVTSNANLDTDARRIYRELIKVGMQRNASDVHFIPGPEDCLVLYRIDGKYEPYSSIPLGFLERLGNIIMTDAKMSSGSGNEMNMQDGQLEFSPSGNQLANDCVPLRIHMYKSCYGKDINIRYLSDKLYTFEELGMSPWAVSCYKRLAFEQHGLIVQTGTMGTGKSTSLYSILNEAHKSWRNILTIEDPVEIHMGGITQINVGQQGQLSFGAALKGTLRHDPDIVVVGEMRDTATAQEALKQADAGKLVITSLHTNDSIGTFERLINLQIDPYSLGEVITYSLGQVLLRRLCPYCKKEVIIDPKDPDLAVFHLENYFGGEPFKAFRPCGCSKCRNIGYKGRMAANEVLHIDEELRYRIQSRAKRKQYEEYLSSTGFISVYEDALSKVKNGQTSLEEVYPLAVDSLAFKGGKYNSRKGGK